MHCKGRRVGGKATGAVSALHAKHRSPDQPDKGVIPDKG